MNTHNLTKLNTLKGLDNLKDYYYVSKEGGIYSTYGQKEGELRKVQPAEVGAGYLQAQLMTKENKTRKVYVHRIVGLAFVEGYQEGLVINHKDEIKVNNHYKNLEWITQKENVNYGTRTARQSKACQKRVEGIDPNTGITCLTFDSVNEAMEAGYTAKGISQASRGEWCNHCSHGGKDVYKGYKWRYV